MTDASDSPVPSNGVDSASDESKQADGIIGHSNGSPHSEKNAKPLLLKLARALSVRLVILNWVFVAIGMFSYLEAWVWPANLVCHYRLQLAILLVGLGLFAIIVRRFWIGLVSIGWAIPTLAFVALHYLPANQASAAKVKDLPSNYGVTGDSPLDAVRPPSRFRVGSLNILCTNHDLDSLRAVIEENDPDIFALLEVTPEWEQNLTRFDDAYPYVISHPEPHAFGIQVRSKHPFVKSKTHWLLEGDLPAVETQIEIEGRQLTLFAGHIEPPISNQMFKSQQLACNEMVEIIDQIAGPLVVVGDFNATPFCSIYRQIKGDRIDSRYGHGWATSWPADHFPKWLPLWIPIDHAFVSPDVRVISRVLGKEIGSDHLPLFVELEIVDDED